MSDIERLTDIALAYAYADVPRQPPDDRLIVPPLVYKQMGNAVRAILTAMRSPSEDQLMIGVRAHNLDPARDTSRLLVKQSWSAMIDHILADGFTTGDTLRTTTHVPIGPDFPKTVYGSEGT